MATKKVYFRPGTRVILKANKKEGWLEERGVVQGKSRECYVVLLDKAFRTDSPFDDGLRETHESGLIKESAKKRKRD